MKKFNLKEAKAGKPVCTESGDKVKIVDFNAYKDYPIEGLVTYKDGKKDIKLWTEEGIGYKESPDEKNDLMMV